MSDQSTLTSPSILDVLPSTTTTELPQPVQESNQKVPAKRTRCKVPGCTAKLTARGMKRHMSQQHPDVPLRKRGRPKGSVTKPKPGEEKNKLVELMWSGSDRELQLHPDGSIWVAKKLDLSF